MKQQPTRKMIKLLEAAGWVRLRTVGSHSLWKSPDETRTLSIPDGHRVISPGVARQIFKALEEGDQ